MGNFPGYAYDAYCESFRKHIVKINRIENLINLYDKYDSDEIDSVNNTSYCVKEFLRDLTKINRFTKCIPIEWGYYFDKGDSVLFYDKTPMILGYGDPDIAIIEQLKKSHLSIEDSLKLCQDVNWILDVTPFRHLISNDFEHDVNCKCVDCIWNKTNGELRSIILSNEPPLTRPFTGLDEFFWS